MGAKYMNTGLLQALNDLIGTQLSGAKVHLYTNNYTPTPSSLPSNFTELIASGYTAYAVPAWSSPVLGSDGFYTTNGTPNTWTNTGGVPWSAVYGWYITDSTDLNVISAGLFVGAIVVGVGGNLPFGAVIACGSEY